MTTFQNEPKVRRRSSGALAAFACLFILIGAGQHDPVVLGFAAATACVAYRNWVAGLFITNDKVVIRNVLFTRRVSRQSVAGADFATSRWSPTGWGYVRLDMDDGRSLRVTALRRNPLDGDSLAQAIRGSLGATSHS